MKHIQKRFFLQEKGQLSEESNKQFRSIDFGKTIIDEQLLKEEKDSLVHMQTESGDIIRGFIHKIDGKHCILPMPDPTLVYFHSAQTYLKAIKENRKVLILKLEIGEVLNEPAIHEIYNFYSLTSGFVIFLFTAIESFLNQIIPDDFVYKNVQTRKTELFDKKQIQENIDFSTKVKKVLKEATGKDFFQKSTPMNQQIWNLKKFRDDIVHTKQEDSSLKYNGLIKTSLAFNYESSLNAVAQFMNHYKKDFIVECNCGMDL